MLSGEISNRPDRIAEKILYGEPDRRSVRAFSRTAITATLDSHLAPRGAASRQQAAYPVEAGDLLDRLKNFSRKDWEEDIVSGRRNGPLHLVMRVYYLSSSPKNEHDVLRANLSAEEKRQYAHRLEKRQCEKADVIYATAFRRDLEPVAPILKRPEVFEEFKMVLSALSDYKQYCRNVRRIEIVLPARYSANDVLPKEPFFHSGTEEELGIRQMKARSSRHERFLLIRDLNLDSVFRQALCRLHPPAIRDILGYQKERKLLRISNDTRDLLYSVLRAESGKSWLEHDRIVLSGFQKRSQDKLCSATR